MYIYRCTEGWKGVLCNIAVTNTVPITVVAEPLDTGHSVFVYLPEEVQDTLKISLKELKDSKTDRFSPTREMIVEPDESPYLVENLHPGKTYNVCISVLRGVPREACSTVKTKPEDPKVVSSNPTVTSTIADDDEDDDVVVGGNKERIAGEGNDPAVDTTNANQNMFELLYPILGAILGALIIVVMVVVFYMCHRDKNKLKQAEIENNKLAPMYTSSARYTPATIIEDTACYEAVQPPPAPTTASTDRAYPYCDSPVMFTSNGGYTLTRDAYQPIPIKPCPVPSSQLHGSSFQRLHSDGSTNGGPLSPMDMNSGNHFYVTTKQGGYHSQQQKPNGRPPCGRQRTTSHPPLYPDERCTSRGSDIERRDHNTGSQSSYATSGFTDSIPRTPAPYLPQNSVNYHRSNSAQQQHIVAHPGLPPCTYTQAGPVMGAPVTPCSAPMFIENR